MASFLRRANGGRGLKSLERPECHAEIVRRIAALTPDTSPRWGRMTVTGMFCHLCDSYRVGLGERTAGKLKMGAPPVLMKWIALYVPASWPKNLPTLPEVDQGAKGTAPTSFDADRAELLRLIEVFRRGPVEGSHPIFGKLKNHEWQRWGYLHADHHLRQFGV